jgi:hypothetical protein
VEITKRNDSTTGRNIREGGIDLGMLLAAGGGGAGTLLWILAVILVIAGIVTLLRGAVLAGVALIVIGCLVGPGGASLFT